MGQGSSAAHPNNNSQHNQSTLELKGTDATFSVGDMLKVIPDCATINYGEPLTITKELLPVEGAFLLHNVLSEEECKQYIELACDLGFAPSPLRDLGTVNSEKANYSDQTQQIRKSDRVLCDIPDRIGEELGRRVEDHLPQTVECNEFTWDLVRLGEQPSGGAINKRWRFNRYEKGGYFRPHYDAGYQYSSTCKTLLTFILYLNDGYQGGETVFFPGDQRTYFSEKEPGIECRVKPKSGSALVFFQEGKLSPRHEGATHLSNDRCKFILRSDIAYRRCERRKEN